MQKGIKEAARTLADIYDAQGNSRRALMFYRKYVEMKDLLLSSEVQSSIANLQTKLAVEEKAQRIKALELERSQQALVRNSLIGGSILLGIIVLLVASSYRAKQRQNIQLQQALKQLRDTQAQLIYAEKMASVGQLATGMAHELQNPLNFVNNFAELSKELCETLAMQIETLDTAEQKKQALQTTVKSLEQNSEKIRHHGERAAGIVRSVLEYASVQIDEKTETDLNALITDALKVAYRLWQEKHKGFEAKLSLDLSPSIGKPKLAPQEMSRVLFNLFSNSLDALREKQMRQTGTTYTPEIYVQTVRQNSMVEIRIRDNGMGIAPEIKEKVFLPFFTTKPAGTGHHGLGLFVSYEIVKGHRGDMTLESKAGEWTEVQVRLPLE
jgi:Signal transduction histidine kinase regulating C4-dicarboxylate transport system